jgi:hypothetical protein
MKRFALLCVFASACADRCLDVDVNVTGEPRGTVVIAMEMPADYVRTYLPDTGGAEVRVARYSLYGRSETGTQARFCLFQSETDDYLVRVAAWVQPEDVDEPECLDRHPCPPEGAPYAETLVTFAKEGVSHAVVELSVE